MFLKFDLSRSLVALAFILIIAATADAQTLFEHQGTSYRTQSDMFAPLAEVVVGGEDVQIGGFGVYGQAAAPANVRWVIFDSIAPRSPAFLSPIHALPEEAGSFAAAASWHDSPGMEFTLLANHRYAMGILSDRLGKNGFRWGVSVAPGQPGGGGPAASAGQFSVPSGAALANAGLSGSFYSTPYVYTFNGADPLQWSNTIQPSLRIMAPVAEPAEWALLLSGLIALSWVAARRNGRPA